MQFVLRANDFHIPSSRRDHSVYQLAVQPTWQTVVLRKELKGRAMDFQMDLMDGKIILNFFSGDL